MAKFNKGYVNANHYSQMSNNPSDLFDYTMTNIMDNFYNSAMNTATDGKFKAVCLSGKDTGDGTGAGTDANDAVSAVNYLTIVVRPLADFGNILPDPRAFKQDGGEKINDIISLHSAVFSARSDYEFDVANPIEFGQIVDCYFEKGSIRDSNFQTLRFTEPKGKLLDTTFQELQLVSGYQPLSSRFENGSISLLGSVADPNDPFGGNHVIQKLEKSVVPSSEKVVGVGSPTNAAFAYIEIYWWTNRDESDVGKKGSVDKNNPAYKRIQLYHYYVVGKNITDVNSLLANYESNPEVLSQPIGGSSEGGTGDSVTGIEHWSATSVSWCMRGSGFPKYFGHSGYSSHIQKGNSPDWECHSLLREKCVAKLGDVVVRTGGHGRGATVYTASHGDIIYKIEGNKAYTAGGNLGSRGKFKQAEILTLDSDGVIIDPKKYLIILKKMR